jgi:hypothetical protein
MKSWRRVAVALILAGAAWGCGGEEPAPETAPQVLPTEAQPDRPLLSPDQVVLTERSRIANGGHWSEAADVAVDAAGSVYVLDAVSPSSILKFDSTGSYVLRFGEGEPDPPLGQSQKISLGASWNTIVTVDRSENAVAAFLTLGMQSYSIPLQESGNAIDALALPTFGEYYLHGWDQNRSLSGVYHMQLPIDTLATTYEVMIPPGQPVGKVARDVYLRTAVDAQGRLYVAFHDGYPVRVLEPSGRTVTLIGIDRERVPRDPAEVAAETAENLDRLRRQAPEVADSILVQAARVDSLYSMVEELAVDPSGRLWVRTNRPGTAGVTSYDVFNEEGGYLARVDVPGAVRATAFAADGALVVVDEAGDPAGVVVRYDVRLGS